MGVVMMMATWLAILTDAIKHAVAGPFTGTLDALQIMLFTNVPTITPQSVIGDLTEPTYTGYARQAFAWGAVWQRPDGGLVITGVNKQFQMGDAALQTPVTGYALVTTGGTPALVAAEMFPTPITLTTVLDALQIMPQVVLGGADNGRAVVQGP